MIVWRFTGGEEYFSLSGTAPPGTGFASAISLTNGAPVGRYSAYAGLAPLPPINLPTNYVTLVAGGCCYIGGGGLIEGNPLFTAKDNGVIQFQVLSHSNGQLFVKNGNGTVIGTDTSGKVIANGQGWSYCECKFTIGASGFVEFKLAGVVWFTLTGVNTQNTVNSTSNQFQFGSVSVNQSYWRDCYVLETTTGLNVDYLGDVQIFPRWRATAGSRQAWANIGGASPLASIQDGRAHTGVWPDGDLSFIYSSSVGDESDFAPDTITTLGTILEVTQASYLRKDGAGLRTVHQKRWSGGAVHESADISLGDTYAFHYDPLETDPATGVRWTQAGYNDVSHTVGTKVIS